MNLTEDVESEGVNWIELAQAVVNTVMNLRVPCNTRNFLAS
jgi:hypothetical protein